MDRINVWDVLRNTLTGEKGLGGIETRGVLRTGMPYSPAHRRISLETSACLNRIYGLIFLMDT